MKKLCKEAQAEYRAAQDRYARFADANRNPAQLTSRAERARLRSEMELAQLALQSVGTASAGSQSKSEKGSSGVYGHTTCNGSAASLKAQ